VRYSETLTGNKQEISPPSIHAFCGHQYLSLMNNHKGTVLICEEEPDVSHCIEMAVESLGYAVLSARDGDEVLSFLQNCSVEISVLLIGLVMPDRGGLDILREIRATVNAGGCRRAEERRNGFSL